MAFLLTEAGVGAAAISAEGESAACSNPSHNALELILLEQADGFAVEAELLGQGAILHSGSSFKTELYITASETKGAPATCPPMPISRYSLSGTTTPHLSNSARSVSPTVALESDASAQAWAGIRDASAALTVELAGAALEKGAPAHDWAGTPLPLVALTEEVPRLAHEWAGPAQ